MNILDQSIVSFLSLFTHHSALFDQLVVDISNNELLKGGALSAAIWWLWFRPKYTKKSVRITLITTLLASLFAVAIARLMVLTLPFRARPIFNTDIGFIAPFNIPEGFDHLSSFPSDHATLAICLAFGIYCASKRLGRLMLLYSFVVILLPRMYLGLHYATDILAGAMIGAFTVYLIRKPWFTETVSEKIYRFSEKTPQLFYAFLFLFTYETSDLYIHVRNIARSAISFLD